LFSIHLFAKPAANLAGIPRTWSEIDKDAVAVLAHHQNRLTCRPTVRLILGNNLLRRRVVQLQAAGAQGSAHGVLLKHVEPVPKSHRASAS
jgi:hypothetical protein